MQMNINELSMVENPNWQTSWAFTGITNEFNSAVSRTRNLDFSLLKYLFYCLSYLSSWWSEWDLNLWPADFTSGDLTS